MAAVIGDVVTDPAHFHAMMAAPALQHQHSHQSAHYHHRNRSNSLPRRRREDAVAAAPRYQKQSGWEPAPPHPTETTTTRASPAGTSRFPSPPPSAEQNAPTPEPSHDSLRHDGAPARMEPTNGGAGSPPPSRNPSSFSSSSSSSSPATSDPQQQPHRPSPSPPPSDPFQEEEQPSHVREAVSPRLRGHTIHVRDLAHIQSLAKAELLTGTGTGILDDQPQAGVRYEISAMPISDVIEMVAALLTKITTTNDLQHDAMQRNMAHQQQACHGAEPVGVQMSPMSTSVLAFHGKNVPAITILSYLSRIHKYCPTTFEVFLSLLVYFDRMTERVNRLVTESGRSRGTTASAGGAGAGRSGPPSRADHDTEMQDAPPHPAERSDADDDDDDDNDDEGRQRAEDGGGAQAQRGAARAPLATYFVVDSFNIHRLVISGVTCASKFFSDVFYTNSRYAKVGGLPLPELNHLELQFLVLNDFRLQVDLETLEQYATMLVEFYAREVVAQRSRPVVGIE